ncbi:MAG: NirD/YgiW/YdeI family stress tolerance protein [Rickettsiales bacterium]
MKKYTIYTIAGMAALTSTTVLANNMTIDNLPNKGMVTLNGTVESIDSEREFTLRDNTGTIGVDIDSNQSLVLKKGDKVMVKGNIDQNLLGKDINATKVQVSKSIVEGMSDTVESIPGISTADAKAYNIGDLPKNGVVKVTGTVSDVDSEEEFTLNDDTGSIDVEMESSQRAALTKGAKVTVIGSLDSDLMGKEIDATKVIVIANAKPNAKH